MRPWLGLLLAASGCFGLSLGDEPFVCGGPTSTLCPPGYDCVFGVCTAQGLPDASPPDGGGIDASCAPTSFQSCQDGTHALVCNGTGTAIIEVNCPGGCVAAEQLCVRCEPNTISCTGDELETCGAEGDVIASTTCHAGCDGSTTPPHCLHLVPQNLPADVCTTPDSTDLEIDTRVDFDTAACEVMGGTRMAQTNGGGDVCLLLVRSVRIDDTGSLRVIGDVPLAIVAQESVRIDGRLDVGGVKMAAGPGGNFPDGLGSSGDTNANPGGGGGGFLTAGGAGHTGGFGDAPAPLGGPAFGVETIVPLTGGGGGGTGGTPCGVAVCVDAVTATGGGSGGGLQLVACQTLDIRATARIDAGGGGGIGGRGASLLQLKTAHEARPDIAVPPAGGGGGGSGGAILIEAPIINLPNGAKVTAAGGGGGSGGLLGGPKGADGGDAHDEIPGAGGVAPGGAGPGGKGGIGNGPGQLPEDGKKGADVGTGGGGAGGGAAGRIRLNARPGHPATIAPGARVVPAASKGDIDRAPSP